MKIHYYTAKNKVDKLNKHRDELPLFINKQTKTTHFTPLMLAAQNGHREMVEFLLREGADLYLQSRGEEDVFHIVLYIISTRVIPPSRFDCSLYVYEIAHPKL